MKKEKKPVPTRDEIIATLQGIADNLRAAVGIFSDPQINEAAARAAAKYEARIEKMKQ